MPEMVFREPRGQKTLEFDAPVYITLDEGEIADLARGPQLQEEAAEYAAIRQKFFKTTEALTEKDPDTRQAAIVLSHGSLPDCISFIQRVGDQLIVMMRSSDFRKFTSDISFLSNLALEAGCRELFVTISSLHAVFTED